MTKLTYGNPPALEDCTDIGTVPEAVVPRTIENGGRFGGKIDLYDAIGMEIPPVRRAWMTVAHYRDGVKSGDVPVPYSVRVPGLGTLVYGNDDPYNGDNWEVLP